LRRSDDDALYDADDPKGVREGSMVGKDFEVGLANLKAVAEN
jgi:hypothetical protein